MVKPKKLKNKPAAAPSHPASTPSRKIDKKTNGKKSIGKTAAEAASDVPAAAAPTMNKHKEEARGGQKGKEPAERSSGFVFFCNGQTKPECFSYRVFGLPRARLEEVERIKPGARLFLYDFDVKLMYGIYKATSKGGLNLVPEAFKGKYPAQVKFKIEKDCIPVPENVFKQAIEENYESKIRFKPDLNSRQVHKLISLFRPISLPTLTAPQIVDRRPPPPAYLPPPEDPYRSGYVPLAPPAIDPRYGSHRTQPFANDPYAPKAQLYLHGRPAPESRHIPQSFLLHNDPYYPTPRSDPYHQTEVRAYYPEKLGQHERYRSLADEVPNAGRLDALYHPERGVMHALPGALPPQQGRWMAGGYDGPGRGYNESIHGASLSWNHMQPDVPISSRYSFAGAAPTNR